MPLKKWSGGLDNAQLQAEINKILDGAPLALDTLNEIAASLGDSPDFKGYVDDVEAALQLAKANKDGSNIEVNSFKQQLGVDNLPFVPIKDFITKEAIDKLTNNGSFGQGVQSWFDPLDTDENLVLQNIEKADSNPYFVPVKGYKSKGDVYDLVNFNGLTNSQLGGKENVTTPSGEWSLLDNDVEQDLELPITGAGYFSGLQPIAYVSFDFKIEDPNSSYNSILNFRNGDLNQTAGIYIGFDRIYANGWSSSGILAFNGIPNLVFGETYHLDIKVDFVNLKVYVYLDDVQILDETDGDNISANTTNKSELDFRLNKKFYIKNFKSGFDGIPNDLVLIHNGLTTPVSPEKQAVIIPVKTIDAITLNTDLIAEVSNDGTNWEQVALEDLGELTSGINYLYGEKDMINIGTTPKVRVRTQNNKDVEIHGIGAKWL